MITQVLETDAVVVNKSSNRDKSPITGNSGKGEESFPSINDSSGDKDKNISLINDN